jgi:hypothetical protein
MTRLAALLALLLCAACGSGGESQPSAAPDSISSTAVVPAADTAWALRLDGAGPLRIGMTFGEARAALGGDLRMSEELAGLEEGADRCDYPRSARLPAGVMVMVQGQRVVRVEVDSGAVATAEGARIGDTEARIQQLYAGRVQVQPHEYTDGHYLVVRPAAASDTTHLLVFETDGSAVLRFRAGQKPQVEYVEGCA